MFIRRAREHDSAAIIALLNPIIAAGIYTAMTDLVSVTDQQTFIQGLPERAIYNLAFVGEGLVGMQDVLPHASETDVGEISTFVALDSHRRGVGQSLTDETTANADRLGYQTLRAIIRPDNTAAIAFYNRQGFEVVETNTTGVTTERRL